MRRISNLPNRLHFLLLVLMCYPFISCVYFNTFYNAETSYIKALNIIEESPIIDEIEVPEQAKKLLAEAIENSKSVLKKYPDSKYVDDAIYIIAKSSFLRDEVAIAESYFNQLLRDYPESKFHSLSDIWLTYTHLRMGKVETARYEIESIQANSNKEGEKLYLIYNILAEISIEDNDIDNIYIHYEKAAEFAPSKSKRISIYGKLVLIAETYQDKVKASQYLVSLGDVAPEKIRIDARMKWITYQRELGNYDGVISEIQRLLGMSEFSPEYMQLELELGKAYKDRGDFGLSKEIFGMLVEKYSKKNETAEAYYQLGFISLMEDFNIELSREYFENSKSEKSSSFYGRESKDLLNKITRYESLRDLYDEAIKNPDEQVEIQSDESNIIDNGTGEDANITEERTDQGIKLNVNDGIDIGSRLGSMGFGSKIEDMVSTPIGNSPDSILFMIGEMLLYDFNHIELALEKLKMLVNKYPNSEFAAQSLYVLSYYEPDTDWSRQLENQYPNSLFLKSNSVQVDTSITAQMAIKRDYAWSLADYSYDDSYTEFDRLYNKYNDTLSAYIRAYISDYYLNDMERTIKHYQNFANRFPNHSYFSQVDNRLKSIEADLSIQKSIYQQGIDYSYTVQYFQQERDFDSTRLLLNNITKGEKSQYKNAANRLKSVIRDYTELIEDIKKPDMKMEEDSISAEVAMSMPPVDTKKDSILFQLAELFAYKLEFRDSAKFYHGKIVQSHLDSKLRANSLHYLSKIDPEGDWLSMLEENYSDTSYTLESSIYQSIYIPAIFQKDFVTNQKENIELCNVYLEYFVEKDDDELLVEETDKSDAEHVINNKVINESEKFSKPFTEIENKILETEELLIDNNTKYDHAEDFVDFNNNGKYDIAEPYIDNNHNDLWDGEEEYIDQGNGIYDFGESYDDIYSNNLWDGKIWYVDKNSNKKWDVGEYFEDLDNDGRKSYKEPYIDKNNNNRYDPAEKIGNSKFNYLAIEFSEPFIDSGNGKYDLGEVYKDSNGDGKWTAAEEFEDSNGDGKWTAAEEFEDANGDGKWTAAEEFEDSNGDGKWTAAEEFEDSNGDNVWGKIISPSIIQDSTIILIDTIRQTVDSLFQSTRYKEGNIQQ